MLRLGARSLAVQASRTKTDLIGDVFVQHIRDLAQKQKAGGGSLVSSSPEIKKQLDEQLNRLAQKFKLPSADVVGKLDVQFDKATVESSVKAVLDGQNLEELAKAEQKSYDLYVAERQAKQKAEAEREKLTQQN